ncbi:hypothetical protein SDC9_76685 [bioreactor metagenome]|uniref:Uncharacterized protein n=1 Tax=bioreactor metagenome TaxID=1076179 RepID=A0A644YNW0_9ZZZZ
MYSNLRRGKNQPGNIVANAGALGAAALHKLQPGGHIVKQIPYFDARAARSAGTAVLDQRAAFIANYRSKLVILRLRLQPYARDRRDGSERFTAKAERTN